MLALHYSRRRSPQPARLVRLVLMRSLCLLRVLRDAPAVLALRYGYISRFYNAYIVALRYSYISRFYNAYRCFGPRSLHSSFMSTLSCLISPLIAQHQTHLERLSPP